jgi:hypothetical protein
MKKNHDKNCFSKVGIFTFLEVLFFGHQPPLPITLMSFWSTRSAN